MAVNSEVNKKRVLLIAPFAIVFGVGLYIGMAPARERAQRSNVGDRELRPNVQAVKSIDYHLARILRNSNEPHEVTVIISVEPEYFVREKMVQLAHLLNQDFPDPKLVRVEILDDQNVADNYIPAGDMYRLFNDAKRGTYLLDRKTNAERIEFSTAHGKPVSEIRIDLTKIR
jgi:hypothetical protein